MENFTVQLKYWNYKKNPLNIYPIKIMITVNRKQTYVLTGFKVHQNQWNDTNKTVVKHENANLINLSIRQKMAEIEAGLIQNSLHGVTLTKKVIKGNKIINRPLIKYAEEVEYNKTMINRITRYGGATLTLNDVDVEWLRKFEDWCNRAGLKKNTINITFKYVGRIIRQAKREKLIQENPFDEFKIPKYQQTDRLYLVENELKALVKLLDEKMDQSTALTLRYFLLGCFTGLRHSDWGRIDDSKIEDELVKIRAHKNQKHVTVPIGVTLTRILKELKGMPKPLSNQKCNVMLKSIAVIAKINKPISTHTGRHTFGFICAKLGLPESATAELMGINAKTVKVYYHLTGENIKRQAAALKEI